MPEEDLARDELGARMAFCNHLLCGLRMTAQDSGL